MNSGTACEVQIINKATAITLEKFLLKEYVGNKDT